MKQFKDLKLGDTIYVKCPYHLVAHKKDGDWTPERVTEIRTGEDGYTGSGWWFMRIRTDRSVSDCPQELCKRGYHWSIFIRGTGSLSECTFEASPHYLGAVRTTDSKD